MLSGVTQQISVPNTTPILSSESRSAAFVKLNDVQVSRCLFFLSELLEKYHNEAAIFADLSYIKDIIISYRIAMLNYEENFVALLKDNNTTQHKKIHAYNHSENVKPKQQLESKQYNFKLQAKLIQAFRQNIESAKVLFLEFESALKKEVKTPIAGPLQALQPSNESNAPPAIVKPVPRHPKFISALPWIIGGLGFAAVGLALSPIGIGLIPLVIGIFATIAGGLISAVRGIKYLFEIRQFKKRINKYLAEFFTNTQNIRSMYHLKNTSTDRTLSIFALSENSFNVVMGNRQRPTCPSIATTTNIEDAIQLVVNANSGNFQSFSPLVDCSIFGGRLGASSRPMANAGRPQDGFSTMLGIADASKASNQLTPR